MSHLDYLVIALYVAGLLAIGFIFSGKMKDSATMFAAGSQSPWWVAGLSGFMTMFSAGTFVVWGGIAYQWGLVGITICLGNAVGVLLAGRFLAAHWWRLGVATPAEYFELRFGKAAIRFYTVVNLLFKTVAMAVALYAIAVLLCALVPLPENAPFRDAQTGNLAVSWAILLCGALVVVYTVAGGLWAVLMTDVLQFIVLSVGVLFVVPLSVAKVGGLGTFWSAAPEGFFKPTTGEYTWWFLIGWVAIQFVSVGGEWAFVQRYLCVPTPADARRGTYLFGILYIVSPLVWMLPPMLYRVSNPGVDHEQAYILACRDVLPAGMLGLMLVAMFSATASSVSSQLNVFSGVLTSDFYRRLFNPGASERRLVLVGRIITVLLGGLLIGGALAVPWVGGAETVVLGVAALLIPPLMLPTVWGLFSKRIDGRAVWLAVAVSFVASGFVKFGLAKNGWLDGLPILEPLTTLVQVQFRTVETLVAVLVPLAVLSVMECVSPGTSAGWEKIALQMQRERQLAAPRASSLPAWIVAWSLATLAMVMGSLSLFDRQQRQILAGFAISLAAIAVAFAWTARRRARRSAIARQTPRSH
ncbi:MAG: sodium:solute symporter family protein [Planctomycetota bacterium]